MIGMGTWRTFDVTPSNTPAVAIRMAITSEAIGAGVDLFDSSPMYGQAEQVLGIALGERRQSIRVATKVWSNSVAEGRKQIERALGYYGGHVDLYQVHNLVAWREYLPILRDLQADGYVEAVGVTHYAHSAFPQIRRIMEGENVDTIQIPYNATEYEDVDALFDLAVERQIGVIVMSPLGTGALVQHSPPKRELAFLESFDVQTWAQALLKWVVSDTRVAVTIPATSRAGRMTENAAAGCPPFFGPEERDRVSWLAARAAS